MILIFGFLIFVEINLSPAIAAVAEAKTKLAVTKIINEAIHNRIVGKVSYHDMMEIHKDSQDKIVLMMPNTVKINQLVTETTLEIEKELDTLKNQGLSLPLGLITGSSLFANTGPLINIGVKPVGVIVVDLIDEFVEAGINQTKHRIFLDIKTELKIIVPMMSSVINVSMQVPVTESIIIGPVPQWYMKFDANGSIQR